MKATLRVTIVSAIWAEPCIFSGWFDVEENATGRGARYTFRVLVSSEGYCFTRLALTQAPDTPVRFGRAFGEALTVLALALDRTVELLKLSGRKDRTLTGEPDLDAFGKRANLAELGFQVSLPFVPAGPQALEAIEALLGPVPYAPAMAQA